MKSPTYETAVQERWGGLDFQKWLETGFWMNHSVVRAYLNRLATGDPECDWLTWFLQDWVGDRRDLRVLVLGCGEGWLERAVVGSGRVARVDAVDVAVEAVARAQQRAQAFEGGDRIQYQVLDLNREQLPADTYDVVIAHSVLHHIESLENAFETIEGSLREHGWMVVNEFVGPCHLQYSDAAMKVIQTLMSWFPDRLRKSANQDGTYDTKHRPALDHVLEVDPSEGVRADELDGFIREKFALHFEAPMGGTVLQLLLWDMVENFEGGAPFDDCMLEWLCRLEELLVTSGTLSSDYRFYVCQRKGSVVAEVPSRLSATPEAIESRAEARSFSRSDLWRDSSKAGEYFDRVAANAVGRSEAWLDENLAPSTSRPLVWLSGPRSVGDALVQRLPQLEAMAPSTLPKLLGSSNCVLVITEEAARARQRRLAGLGLVARGGQLLVLSQPHSDNNEEQEWSGGSAVVKTFAEPLETALGCAADELVAGCGEEVRGSEWSGPLVQPLMDGLVRMAGHSSSRVPTDDLLMVLGGIEAVLIDTGLMPDALALRLVPFASNGSLVSTLLIGRPSILGGV